MSGRPRMSSSGTDFYKKFREITCINNYDTFRTEIEKKINDFRRKTKKKFCAECDIIKKLIYKKKNELYSYCDNKSFPDKLIETNDKIKAFIEQCPDLSKCSDNHAPNARKSFAAGKPQLYSCNNGGCVTGRETQGQKGGKAKPEIQRASSEIRDSEGPKALEKNRNPDATAELQKKNVIKPAKHTFTLSDSSAGSDTETPEQKVNSHSRITGHEDTQTHHISVSVPSSTSVLDTCTVPISLQSSSTGELTSCKSSQETDLSKTILQITPGEPDVSGKPIENQIPDNKGDGDMSTGPERQGSDSTVDGTSRVIASGGVSSDVTPNVSVSDPKEVNTDCTPNKGASCSKTTDVVNRKSRTPHTESSVGETANRLDPASKASYIENDVSSQSDNRAAHINGEISEQKGQLKEMQQQTEESDSQLHLNSQQLTLHLNPTPGAHVIDDAATYSLTSSKSSRPYGKEEEVELSTKNIDQDTSIMNLITTYQKYIINAVVPLIIILLLILLMKYTPLRSIFTKKKRKKQNVINEKLQRVLQQPSTESEQRRIPFSYSAFEYSP